MAHLKLSRSASCSCKWYLEQKCPPRDVLGRCRICCPALAGDACEKLPPEAEVGTFWRGEEWFRLQAFLEQRCELLHTQPSPDGCSSEPWCPGKGGCVLRARAVRSSCSSPGCSRHLTLARLFLLPPCSWLASVEGWDVLPSLQEAEACWCWLEDSRRLPRWRGKI